MISPPQVVFSVLLFIAASNAGTEIPVPTSTSEVTSINTWRSRPTPLTQACKQNEIWNKCANNFCGRWDCYQVIQPRLCIDSFDQCEGACLCKGGFLRSKNGNCIPIDQCFDELCTKPYEVHVPNSSEYWDETHDDFPTLNCECKEGFHRDDNDDCIEGTPYSTTEPETTTCSEDTELLLSQGNAALTGKLLNIAHKSNPKENLILSAFSVLIPLGQLGYHAGGETYDQIIKILNLRDKNDIRCVFPSLLSRLRAENDVVLNLANKIYTTKKYPVKQSFLNDTEDIFDAKAESIDFNNQKAAADQINQWVESKTNNRIKDIATPDMFDDDTRLVLVNALYFLGNWMKKFNVDNTIDRDFYVDKETTIQVPTMYQEGYFNYGEREDLNCKVLQMFYKGGNFSFVVYLPNEVNGLPTLVEKLEDSNTLYKSYDGVSNQKVHVFLPKIKAESKYNLKEILQKVGIEDLFNKDKSNLTDILEEYEPLYISTAVQKAFGEVDEKGTEAAAANIFVGAIITSGNLNPEPVAIFRADRPFVYCVFNKRDVLFCGTFVNKNKE